VDTKAVVLKSIKNELRSVGGFTWAGYDEAGAMVPGQQLQSGKKR